MIQIATWSRITWVKESAGNMVSFDQLKPRSEKKQDSKRAKNVQVKLSSLHSAHDHISNSFTKKNIINDRKNQLNCDL